MLSKVKTADLQDIVIIKLRDLYCKSREIEKADVKELCPRIVLCDCDKTTCIVLTSKPIGNNNINI